MSNAPTCLKHHVFSRLDSVEIWLVELDSCDGQAVSHRAPKNAKCPEQSYIRMLIKLVVSTVK